MTPEQIRELMADVELLLALKVPPPLMHSMTLASEAWSRSERSRVVRA